jgi:hypothetical protein
MSGRSDPPATRRLAWAGVSLEVPARWELTLYKFLRRGVRRIEVEDEYTLRLEAEWIAPRRDLRPERILRRYSRAVARLTRRADRQEAVSGLPAGWTATRFDFSGAFTRGGQGRLQVDRRTLVTAFHLAPDSSLFLFLAIHATPEDPEDPLQVLRAAAAGLRNHARDALVPWELFDIRFELPRDFELEATRFDIGSKLMVFRWNLRKLYLWHLSCADQFLKDGVDPARWLAGFMNDSYLIRGGRFALDEAGRIVWRRRRRHWLGHRSEIARWCFQYRVAWRLDRPRNRLVAWVFNYRRPEDLNAIPASLLNGSR